jgi:hypothetical protein
MPTGKNWLNFIFINLAFAFYIIGIIYVTSVQEIKKNWALYRCNPMYMPLSDNVQADFAHCVQNIQMVTMGGILKPLTSITSGLTDLMSGLGSDLANIGTMIATLKNSLGGVFGGIFAVFTGMVVGFQKISLNLKDMMGKNVGVIAVFVNILDTSFKTMGSMWNGPTGGLVRSLGKCFHPEIKVQLENGRIVCMKDLNLGDVLVNGSIVEAVMKINNRTDPEQLYVLKGRGVGNADIYVTGSHMIYDEITKKFIRVNEYLSADFTSNQTDWFSCLITSDHKIQIGSELFWDWEDHLIQ